MMERKEKNRWLSLINLEQAMELLKCMNYFHDASLKQICFTKERTLNKMTGDLIYPYEKKGAELLCNIEVELLHNNYLNAKNNQIVTLLFKDVVEFRFMQNNLFDYSDIYEVKCSVSGVNLVFAFCSTKELLESLTISCSEVLFNEK